MTTPPRRNIVSSSRVSNPPASSGPSVPSPVPAGTERGVLTEKDRRYLLAFPDKCSEEVTRRGELEPCEAPAVAARFDPEEGSAYPVCSRHARAPMASLADLLNPGAIVIEVAAVVSSSPATPEGGREAVVNEQIHDWIDQAVAVQDAAYGPFSRDVAGVRLAIAVMEDEIAETRDAWRFERRRQDGQSVRWAMTREEALQVVANGFRLIRAATTDDPAAPSPASPAEEREMQRELLRGSRREYARPDKPASPASPAETREGREALRRPVKLCPDCWVVYRPRDQHESCPHEPTPKRREGR